jgi:Cu-processing system ATP-binding protein
VTFHVTPAPEAVAEVALALPEAALAAGLLTLTCKQDDKLRLLARISDLGAKVADIDIQPPSLEDIYSHFSKRAGQ